MKNYEILKHNFIKKAKEKFGDKFDYSKVDYKGSRIKVIIICPIHGEFEIRPEGHLKSVTGCPKCSNALPKKEVVLETIKRKDMKEYRIWKAMRSRVYNVNRPDAKYYSLKGVTICKEWDDFAVFYNDMGPCPDGGSIDRIDPNKGYFPENCRWATHKEQSSNRGVFNHVFTYNGESHILKDWAKIFNIKYTTLYQRIFRTGLSFEDAIKEDPFKRLIEYENEKHTLKEWCNIKNMDYNLVLNRIDKHKWSFEDAISIPKGGKRK